MGRVILLALTICGLSFFIGVSASISQEEKIAPIDISEEAGTGESYGETQQSPESTPEAATPKVKTPASVEEAPALAMLSMDESQAQGTDPLAGSSVPSHAKEMSIYGEIQSASVTTNSINVQYYDYDSDEEKSIEIFVDPATKIENAASLAAINNGDWADVTYFDKNRRSVAKVITVEKEEPAEERYGSASAPAETPEEEL